MGSNIGNDICGCLFGMIIMSQKVSMFWKEQTEMIDKAKELEQLINDVAQQQRREIEQRTG